MPIFEYKCKACGNKFELLLRGRDTPFCPVCGSEDLEKLVSLFSSNVKKGFAQAGGGCGACSGGSCSTCGHVQEH